MEGAIAHNSRTNRRKVFKLGDRVAHVPRYVWHLSMYVNCSTSKVNGLGHKVT